jgi:hypothetical protein
MRLLKSTILISLFLFSFSFNLQAESANEWYVILGSFPLNDKGLNAANQLREKFNISGFNQDELIVGESNFYQGLAKGLYVVMAGAFQTQQQAKQWMNQEAVKKISRGAYIKQARARQD